MKSLYLILAATAVIVTCKPQSSNNDIIWYPVDGEEGVFISIFGEKYRTPKISKWRSHRRPRYSGMDPAWSFDPTENQDPSFFHNIHERRPSINIPPLPEAPTSFENQEFTFNRPPKRPQGQGNQNNNFQDILNEVFGTNKYPSVSEYPGGRPAINNQWANLPPTEYQWGGNPVTENTNQWNNRPVVPQQWGSNSGSSANELPWQRPSISNQWSSSRPSGGTGSRPTESEWITQINTSRPNRPASRPTSRPTNQSDKLIFPDEDSTTSSSNLIPMDPTTRSPCESTCPVTPEFNPVCGSDGVTYSNAGRLKCAQMCGKNVKLSHHSNCGRTPFIVPLVSKNSRQRKHQTKFGEFW